MAFNETCPHCGCDHEYRNDWYPLAFKVCPECGHIVKPCALCDHDKCDCNKCPLGADISAVVMQTDRNGGLIDWGMQFGLGEFAKSVGDSVGDHELVKGWVDSLPEGGGGDYRIVGDYRIYRLDGTFGVQLVYVDGRMLVIDPLDSESRPDYLVVDMGK